MNDREWKRMQDELKHLQPDHQDTPQDAYRFKQRVLEEYERRTRFEWRAKWTRRAATALTVCCAVCVGVFVAPPFTQDGGWLSGLLSDPGNVQSVGEDQRQDLSTRALVTEFFDLVLQNRNEAAAKLLSDDLRREPFPVVVNKKAQHMTGFSVLNMSVGLLKVEYAVNVAWSTGQDHAEVNNYQLQLKQQGGRWVIASVRQHDTSVYDGAGGRSLVYTYTTPQTDPAVQAESFSRSELPEQGVWTSFAYNPRTTGIYFVMPEERPVLYLWKQGRKPHMLARLPQGRVDEVIANDEAVVAVNFTPQGQPGRRQVLFYDGMTGDRVVDTKWLDQHLNNLDQYDVEVIHSLPGNRFRLRVGANTYLLDIKKSKIELDGSQPATITQVKYDMRLPVAPAGGMAVTDQLPPDVAVPQEMRIDPQEEVGMYVVNGSVESFTFGPQDVKLKLRKEPARVQVLAIPLSMLQPYAGASFEVNGYGEDDKLLYSRAMKIPTGNRR